MENNNKQQTTTTKTNNNNNNNKNNKNNNNLRITPNTHRVRESGGMFVLNIVVFLELSKRGNKRKDFIDDAFMNLYKIMVRKETSFKE